MINKAVPLNTTANDQLRRMTPNQPNDDAKNMTMANKVIYKILPNFYMIENDYQWIEKIEKFK